MISPAQTAYIPGRFIGENSRIMYDTIEHVNSISSTGIIMAVDFEAAFDTVSWEFLTEALYHYNFGPNQYQLQVSGISCRSEKVSFYFLKR